jgi:bacterioferritin-associated ferredoxin
LAGSGPLLLVLAKNLIKAGASVSAIVEATSLRDMASKAHHILLGAGMPRLRQGINYLRAIRAHHIPIYRSHIVYKATGNQEVSEAIITKVDSAWKPIEGTQKTFPVDTVAVGYSLIPSVELSRICGCRHSFDERLGYWRVERNESMETTIPGVFTAGDGAQIKGYQAAIDEGRIAGMAACAQLGKLSFDEADQLIRPLQSKLKRAKQFAEALDAISATRPGILDSIPDDTVICRCEEVRLADLRRAITNGAADINDVKRRTRLGMGHCQGRFCGQLVNELLWKLSGNQKQRDVFTPRIPAKPVPFGALLE